MKSHIVCFIIPSILSYCKTSHQHYGFGFLVFCSCLDFKGSFTDPSVKVLWSTCSQKHDFLLYLFVLSIFIQLITLYTGCGVRVCEACGPDMMYEGEKRMGCLQLKHLTFSFVCVTVWKMFRQRKSQPG